ncbi:MAG: TolC family protein [Prolixibacteraceae bacterium]|nr:TolC family protein [Prolixibacteraceae bacterium]
MTRVIKKKSIRITILFIFVLLYPAITSAQDSVAIQNFLSEDITDQIPPLHVLIDSAIEHNPLVDFRDLQIILNRCKLRAEQSYWMRNIGIQADVRYGTFNVFSTNTAEGQTPDLTATQNVQTNYGIGAYIKFPLQDFINRKNQIEMARAEMAQAESMLEQQRREVRQMVITQYNDLVLKQRLLRLRLDYNETSLINLQMAETQFRNGVIPISEYSRLSEMAARSQSDYETVRVEFITAYLILEEIVGYKFMNELTIEK